MILCSQTREFSLKWGVKKFYDILVILQRLSKTRLCQCQKRGFVMTDFTLSSSDFSENQLMGATFQADHPECASPQLSWSGAPAGTKGFAIAMHDPDAPTGGAGWWHWMVLVLPADVTALARGAGVAGLAAMPAHWQRGGLHWQRPLLGVAGQEVRAWLRARGQAWVEDPTNSDERYTRNRIRRQLLPALQQAFPQFRDTFARSCAHAAQAHELLQELAQADLATVGQPPRIAALRSLSRARQANVLRHWLRSQHGATPTAAQLDALLRQIAACSTRGHRIQLKVGSGHVLREGELLGWYNQPVLDFISARDGGAPKQSSQ